MRTPKKLPFNENTLVNCFFINSKQHLLKKRIESPKKG